MVTSFIFLSAAADCWPALMRCNSAYPEDTCLGPDQYNEFFTMHGSTMMFLFAVPMMFEAIRVSTSCRSWSARATSRSLD